MTKWRCFIFYWFLWPLTPYCVIIYFTIFLDNVMYIFIINIKLLTIRVFLPHPRVKVSIVGSLRDREVACSASDRQGSNFESCVWRTVSSQSSHNPQEVLLAQFSLYVHKGGLKPDSFHLFLLIWLRQRSCLFRWYYDPFYGQSSETWLAPRFLSPDIM